MSNRVLFISGRCPHSKKVLLGIHQHRFLKEIFEIVNIDVRPYPHQERSLCSRKQRDQRRHSLNTLVRSWSPRWLRKNARARESWKRATKAPAPPPAVAFRASAARSLCCRRSAASSWWRFFRAEAASLRGDRMLPMEGIVCGTYAAALPPDRVVF